MLLEDVINVVFVDVPTVLGESLLQVIFCNLAGVVDVELVEYGHESFFGEELVDVDCCCDELTVVDPLVFSEVKLLDNGLDLFGVDTHIGLHYYFFQFLYLDEATAISVNFFELCF